MFKVSNMNSTRQDLSNKWQHEWVILLKSVPSLKAKSTLTLHSFFIGKPCLQVSIFRNDAGEVALADWLIQLDSQKTAAAF